eukprot:scaffold1928_cov381-Prasinococcus_capsulatus_cf.AAC.26
MTALQASADPKWWLGEPLWQSVVKAGKVAATFFWPGSECVKGGWTCDPQYCAKYDSTVPYTDRVDQVLTWIDMPIESRPQLITLYFEEPDHSGHAYGPDSPEVR